MINLNQLFTNLVTLTIFFVLLFSFTKIFGPPLKINSITTNRMGSFEVTGEGKVSIKSNSATIRVGVNAEEKTAKEAQDKLNQNINKVIAAIKALGVSEEDIKTENYNVYETGDEINIDSDTTLNKRYGANSNVVIKTKDIALANKILDTAIQNGANQIGGVSFDSLDKTKAENEARELAVKDAKAKAQRVANTAGLKLGDIVSYFESTNNSPYPYPMMEPAMKDSGRGEFPTQLESGKNELIMTVTISYELK